MPPLHIRARKREYRALAASDQSASPVCSGHKPRTCIPYMSAAIENNLLNGRVTVTLLIVHKFTLPLHRSDISYSVRCAGGIENKLFPAEQVVRRAMSGT